MTETNTEASSALETPAPDKLTEREYQFAFLLRDYVRAREALKLFLRDEPETESAVLSFSAA